MHYLAFGFVVKSDMTFPELIGAEEKDADVTIQQGRLKEDWQKTDPDPESFYAVQANRCFLMIDDVGLFLIENGCTITYEREAGATDSEIRLFLLGSCMGALLFQRSILPLHGSAFEKDGQAFAVVGHSGAGKSTLATAMLDRGYRLVSDDVIPVTFDERGIPYVTPAYPQQKLWGHSLDLFGMDSGAYRSLLGRRDKFAIPVEDAFATARVPITGIVELVKDEAVSVISVEDVTDLRKLSLLYEHTYRNYWIEAQGLTEWHFQTSAALAEKVAMHKVVRPANRATARELAEIVEIMIKGGRENERNDAGAAYSGVFGE